ncbi:group 1 glycosyl transferase [Mycolicibacterium aurum]|uniref:Group 1 glycosyl transferase n=1 Tax=Mycolicibacterium aurum TaxID=1791 RepID=A0A448IGZ1_MYCAU|nr:glycosyltransferase [Mycolicibacterium aurum]VEG51735.1 group 1 glycosyl transferase [Mycolicibacterium aurum]
MQSFSYVPSIGILSTYAPTVCGLATFSAALAGGLSQRGVDVNVVRIADGASSADGDVVGELVNGSASSVAATAELLNKSDVAVIQHEYGIYGGADGDEVVEIMKKLTVPSIVIAHTVLKNPTPHQRSVLNAVLELADQVVVMSESARACLCAGFTVDRHKIATIPHGAALPTAVALKRGGRPIILTWGLLGPGKGVERVIDAMPALKDLAQRPRYLVAGRTHPKVLAAQGETYREGLIAQAERLGVADAVSFDSAYRTPAQLTELMQSASVVVLPYDSKDQVTSGVLVDSVASGRPIVATAFPHAVELLGSGAGTVVGHDDPAALTAALRRTLTDPRAAGTMASEARGLAPAMAWPVVANAYVGLAQRLVAARLAVA